jgi:hypothetical protein
VAGRALEALLQGVGYDTCLFEDPPERSPEQLLEGVRLLLLAPTLSAESRETLLAEMGSTLDAANIPVLALSTSLKEALAGGPAFIHGPAGWKISPGRSKPPCSACLKLVVFRHRPVPNTASGNRFQHQDFSGEARTPIGWHRQRLCYPIMQVRGRLGKEHSR